MALVMMATLFFSILQMAAQAASISENSCSEVPAEADAEQSGCLMQTKHQIFNEKAVDDTHKKAPKSKPQKKDEEVDESDKKTRPHKVAKDKHGKKEHGKKHSPSQDFDGDDHHANEDKKKKSKKGSKNGKAKAASFFQRLANVRKGLRTKGLQKKQRGINVHEMLPDELFDLAEKLFVTQEAIAEVIDNSVLVDVTHAGVNMSIRMSKDDDAVKRLGEEGTWSSYDLETLGDEAADTKDMLNMLDIGGNYGVITIAAMKKYAKRLRVITIEPAPKTFFFLKWNLHINGIPEIHHKDSLDEDQHVPGVIALNRGSADVEGQDLHFCFYKESSMNSKVCDCKRGDDGCVIVPSITIDNMAGMFGIQPIAMVKMDCEGCEFKSLPALAQAHVAHRVRRLAGELHLPDQNLEDIACRWNNGRLMSKCQRSKANQENIECAVELDCPKSPGK